jgi:hypothetical protein
LGQASGGIVCFSGEGRVPDISFDQVWQRIDAHAGERFEQIRGGEFTYEVRGGSVRPDRTNRALSRSQFEQAYALMPVENTAALQRLQGPSYLYAILMDRRIREHDW